MTSTDFCSSFLLKQEVKQIAVLGQQLDVPEHVTHQHAKQVIIGIDLHGTNDTGGRSSGDTHLDNHRGGTQTSSVASSLCHPCQVLREVMPHGLTVLITLA